MDIENLLKVSDNAGNTEEWQSVSQLHHREDNDKKFVASDHSHEKLLEAISSIGRDRKKPSKLRYESTPVASEFSTSAGHGEKVILHDLVTALNRTTSHKELKKKLGHVDRGKKFVPLAVPPPKHELEKIDRKLGYEKTSKELKIWDPVVQAKRQSEQLHFPLQRQDVRLVTSSEYVKRFKPRTPLEMEVAKILHGSEDVLEQIQVLTKAEERARDAMNIQMAMERRAQLKKHRALLHKEAVKAKRNKKIKSKGYHRILKKEKIKVFEKTLEELQQKDPDAFLEKLQQMDRKRLQERMSLKHRGGSKFMKKQAVYAKYDDNVKQAVQDMVKKNKELLEKVVQSEEENEMSEVEDINIAPDIGNINTSSSSSSLNPWMKVGIKKKSGKFSKPQEIVNEAVQLEKDDIDEETIVNPSCGDVMDSNVAKSDCVVIAQQGNIDYTSELKSESKSVLTAQENESDEVGKSYITNIKSNEYSPKGIKRKEEDHTHNVSSSKKKAKKGKKKQMQEGGENEKSTTDKQLDLPNAVVRGKVKIQEYDNIDDIFEDAAREKLRIAQEEKIKHDKIKEREKQKVEKRQAKRLESRDRKKEKTIKDGKKKKKKQNKFEDSESESLSESSSEEEYKEEEGIMSSLKRKNKIEDFSKGDDNEEFAKEQSYFSNSSNKSAKNQKVPSSDIIQSNSADDPSHSELDPNRFFTVDSSVRNNISHGLVEDEEDDYDNNEDKQRMTIAQAFASDDVIDEFAQLKKEEEESENPKDIDLNLPGWGSWGGTGIKMKTNKRLIIKAPKNFKRKDHNLKNIIISEHKDTSIAKHQVKEVPFPFTNVSEFQNSLRQPLGKTWNPESAYKALTKRKMTTEMGKVIDPIEKEVVFKDRERNAKGEILIDTEEHKGQNSKKRKRPADNTVSKTSERPEGGKNKKFKGQKQNGQKQDINVTNSKSKKDDPKGITTSKTKKGKPSRKFKKGR